MELAIQQMPHPKTLFIRHLAGGGCASRQATVDPTPFGRHATVDFTPLGRQATVDPTPLGRQATVDPTLLAAGGRILLQGIPNFAIVFSIRSSTIEFLIKCFPTGLVRLQNI